MLRLPDDHDLTGESMFRHQSPPAVALTVFALLLLLLLPKGPQENERHAVLQVMPEDSNRTAGYGDPDQFFAYHAAIRGLGDGPGYPDGYRIDEFRKALAARKRPGRQLFWVERGPANVPGRTRAVIVDPDDPSHRTWYVGSVSGGLWKTGNAGETWESLTEHLPNLSVSALAMAPSDPNVIYMGTGEGFSTGYGVQGSGIFKSSDRGRTWQQLRATISKNLFGFINRIIIDPSDANVVLAATNDGIYRTVNGGAYWSKEAPGNMYDLKARPDNFSVQLATRYGSILRSTDGGGTWESSISEFKRSAVRIEVAFAPSNPDIVYALVDAAGGPILYRSADSGASWELVHGYGSTEGPDWTGFQGTYNLAIGVDPFDENKVIMGGVPLWEATIVRGTEAIRSLAAFEELSTYAFLRLVKVRGDYFGSRLLTGHGHTEVSDITPNDFVTVEWRFGPGRSQKAHRFSVSRTAGRYGDGGSEVALASYRYEDYSDVPFEVWDTENNRQLMVSFRDQADDGEFNLAPLHYSRERDEATWEHVFIHAVPYDSTSADERIAQDGGVATAMLYMLWPTLRDNTTWEPNNLPESMVRITAEASVPLELEAGEHPASRSVHVDHHVIHCIPMDETRGLFWVLNANDGGVYLSENSGASFRHITGGYNTTQFYGVSKRPGRNQYIAGSQDNGTWRSGDDPNKRQAWIQATGGDGIETVWHATDDNLVLASSQFNSIWRSTTAGETWRYARNGLSDVGGAFAPFLTQFGYSSERPNRVFMIGRTGVWRSTDFGESWHSIPIPNELWYYTGGAGVGSGRIRVSLANPDVVWAGIRLGNRLIPKGTVHVSTDGGDTFEPTVVPDFAPHTPISGMATHPVEDSTAYVLFSRSGRPKIVRTTDLGQTWTDLSGFYDVFSPSSRGFPNVAVYDLLVMPHDPDIMWAGTEIGIFESTDAGESWLYSDNGMPAVSVWQMRIIDGQIVVATYGRGIWTLDLSRPAESEGYGPALGTDFIFFSSGTNTRIEAYDGRPVPDPLGSGPEETVLRYDFGRYQSFHFRRDLGVDLTYNRAIGDFLHLRLLVDPRVSDRNQGRPVLVFEDKTDDRRAEDGSADLPFRATWRIPIELRDGQWHELAIPLPPATWQGLEDARSQGRLRGLVQHWQYNGAVTAAGLRVATDGRGPATSVRPELWKEFEWGNVQSLGIAWESDQGGGPVWVDDVYIGGPELDLSIADAPVMAMSGVSVNRSLLGNVVSWDPNASFGGYNVYASRQPITDVSADDVFLLRYLFSGAAETSFAHRLELPHDSFAPLEVHYAVTSLSTHGVENLDVSGSAASITNPNLPVTSVIVELTDREADLLRASLVSGSASGDGFPEWLEPFRLDALHSSPGEGGTIPERDEELSGSFWMGQSARNELFVYGEVKDDVVRMAGQGVPPDEAWQYDSIELGWGNYDVREVPGGSFLVGSPHRTLERGAHADYHIRIAGRADGAARIYVNAGTGTYVPVPGSVATYDELENPSGQRIGWKVLAAIPLNGIQNAAEQDAVLAPVTGTELRLVPMNLALNDADETGRRDNQIQWSTKHNADARWWTAPAQWPVVAVAGRLTWTGIADELGELPVTFSLEQNYPNPFNPATTIAFSLASDEPVTLTVFDALGRRVAVLLNGGTMARGSHSVRFEATGLASGVYFYQLQAGDAYLSSKQMMLVK